LSEQNPFFGVIAKLDLAINLLAKKDGPAGQARG
jgi:hypothetical protein